MPDRCVHCICMKGIDDSQLLMGWLLCLTLMSMMSALLVALLYCGWGIKTWGLRNCSVPSYNPTEKSPATILMFAALKTQSNTDFHQDWFLTWVQELNFYCILLYFCFNINCIIRSHLWFLEIKPWIIILYVIKNFITYDYILTFPYFCYQ